MGTGKPSMASVTSDPINLRLNAVSALDEHPAPLDGGPTPANLIRNTNVVPDYSKRPSTCFRTIGREHRQ